MLRLLNFRCSFCSNPLDETQSKERRGEFRIGGAEACGMESGMGAKRIGDAARILEAQNEVVYAEERKLSEIPVVGTMQAD